MKDQLFSAVVLAAGRSIRMGRDKALLEAGGVPLWERQRDVLAKAGVQEVFLSVRPDQAWAQGARKVAGLVQDPVVDAGPLAGIVAGLTRMTNPWLAVLAVDLPKMTAEWFLDLRRDCNTGVGAVGRRAENYEPLAAIYPREIMPIASAALVRGEYSLQALVAKAEAKGLMQARDIPAAQVGWFENWNEPDPAGH